MNCKASRLATLFAALCLLAGCGRADAPSGSEAASATSPPASSSEPSSEASSEGSAASAEASSSAASSPESPSPESELSLYLNGLAQWNPELEQEFTLVRDDIGLRIPAAPYLAESLAELLLTMNLRPYEDGAAGLELPHPFSLLIETDGRVDTISLAAEKVTVNGADYSPGYTGGLAAFLGDQHERFLTGDPYLLQTEMPFPSDEVAEITLTEEENYSTGVTEVVIRDPADISRIVRALNQAVARRFDPDEEPGAFAGVGGNSFRCALTLAGGGEWSITPAGRAVVATSEGEEVIFVLHLDHEAVFGLLARNEAAPQLTASMGGLFPTVYETDYSIALATKSRSDIIPLAMFFDADAVLPPTEGNLSCSLEWLDDSGKVTPVSVAATLYPGVEEWSDPVGEGLPVELRDDKLILPGAEGKYFVTVRAEFDGGGSVQHIFSYRVSH